MESAGSLAPCVRLIGYATTPSGFVAFAWKLLVTWSILIARSLRDSAVAGAILLMGSCMYNGDKEVMFVWYVSELNNQSFSFLCLLRFVEYLRCGCVNVHAKYDIDLNLCSN